MRDRLIGVDEPVVWRAALSELTHAYWHRWEPCYAASLASGHPTFLYVCYDASGRIQAACPLSERSWHGTTDIFTPAGFSGFVLEGPSAGVSDHWRAFVRSRGYVCGYFALHPLLACRSLHHALHNRNDLFVVDLSAGADVVIAGSARQVRRSLADWRSSGREFEHDSHVLTAFIVEHYAEFMAGVRANPDALRSREGLETLCRDDQTMMAGVVDAHGVCAVLLVGTSPPCAEALINVSVREGRRFTRALTAWAIRELAGRGIQWFNLGGGVRRGDDVAEAKRRFRPAELPLWSAREVYRPKEYEAFCDEVEVGRQNHHDYFPEYRRHEAGSGATPREPEGGLAARRNPDSRE